MTSNQVSPKSYTVAVCLSAIFGVLGIQHFYLGRYLHGIADIGLTVAFAACFIQAAVTDDLALLILGAVLLLADVAHTLVSTFMILTGTFRDGEGRLLCYPGQSVQ